MTDLNALRRKIVEIAYRKQEGHIPSSLSVLPIIAALYDDVLGVTPENWEEPGTNMFVLSKGHAALALYVVLEAHGFITGDDLDSFAKPGGILGGHPTRDIPGVWASTGSLGHGLPIAVGIAHAKKIKGEAGRVHCLTSDGELGEGSCWEAMRLAGALKLDNLCVLIDDNHSHPSPMWLHSFAPFRISGSILCSTDPADIALRLCETRVDGWPHVVMIRTTKGHGVARMEKEPQAWHRRTPTPEEYRQILEELG